MGCESLIWCFVLFFQIVELGDAIGNTKLHRQDANDDRLTMFDTSGVAVQDIMITKYVVDALAHASKTKCRL